MIYLVSNSVTRAEILLGAKIEFKQIKFDFNESIVSKNCPPSKYVMDVVRAKKHQFEMENSELKNLLFADSCVECDGQILCKPLSKDEAFRMLKLQSNNFVQVLTGMIFKGEKFELLNLSKTVFKFEKFNENDLNSYVNSGLCMDKAGAMMIEGFNKPYILYQDGYTSTARGLNIEVLKAFL